MMRVWLALFTVYVVWGSTFLGMRFALEGGFAPFWLGALRFFCAGVLLYTLLRVRGYAHPTARQWRNGLLTGFFLFVLGNGLVTVALQSVSSGITAVAVASVALWLALFGAMAGSRLSRAEKAGLALGFAGIVLLNTGGELAASPVGLVCLMLSAPAWAFATLWGRRLDLPAPFMTAALQMLCAAPVMAVIALARGEALPMPDAAAWAAFAYLVLLGSIVAFSAYTWLAAQVRPALLGSYAYVNPVVAVLLGMAFAGERPGAGDFAAIAVILGGVVLLTLAKTRRKT